MQGVAARKQEEGNSALEAASTPADHLEQEQTQRLSGAGEVPKVAAAPAQPEDAGDASGAGPYDWMGMGEDGQGGAPPPEAPEPEQEQAEGAEPASLTSLAGGGDFVLPEASSPGGLLSSLTGAPASSLLGAYERSRAQAPKLLGAQWEATVQGLPQVPTPTGIAPEAPAPEAQVEGERSAQVKLEAGKGEAPPATADVPAPAPAMARRGTEIGEDQVQGAAAGALAAVRLPSEAVSTRFQSRPKMALGGDSDPGRMAGAKGAMEQEVGGAHRAALGEAGQDFGEGAIAPSEDSEVLQAQVSLAEPQGLDAPEAPVVELPPEMAAQVDGAAGPLLQGQMQAPVLEHQAGEQAFHAEKAAAHEQARADMAAAEQDAVREQLGAREGASAEVQAAKERWREEVDAVQADAQAQATKAHGEQQGAIEKRALQANSEAQAHLDDAEKKAAAHKKEAEAKAAKEKAKADQESGGFLGWVASKAKALVDGLKAAMNTIYDGLRAAVKLVFEAAKKLAEAAIELGRKAIVLLIEGYATLLKGILKVALAAFPKLADAACKRIDQAKAKATELVNKAAATLKSVTSGILDFLSTTLDKALGLVQSLYNGAFTLIGMVISGQWKEIVKGLKNLGDSAAQAPPQFEAAAYEEVLGGDMSQPLSPAEMALAGLTPPGAAQGGGGGLDELSGPPWTQDNVGVEQVLSGLELSPELQEQLMTQTGGQGEVEFGQSNDPSRSMESILGLEQGADTAGAGQEVVPDDGLSVSERAGAKWTIMKKGISDWWSKNWPLVLAGGVIGTAAFIAANILSGGAVLAAVPPILSVLGPLFMGLMAVQMGGYVAGYLEKGWAGDTQPAGKSLAKALAVGAIELISYLTFKAGGAALKGAKALAGGAKQLAKGAVSLAKRGVAYVIKQGKVLLKGLSNTGFGKAFKKLGALGKGLLSKTKFKGFRIRVGGGRFRLEGKVNPWVLLADGKVQWLDNSQVTRNGNRGNFKLGEELRRTSDGLDGVVVGTQQGNKTKLVRSLESISDASGQPNALGVSGDDVLPMYKHLTQLDIDPAKLTQLAAKHGLSPDELAKVMRQRGEDFMTRLAGRSEDEIIKALKAASHEIDDGGHSLLRHGPDHTDPALNKRLNQGIAPDQSVRNAPGGSTKFQSYDDWLKTRDRALQEIQAGNNNASLPVDLSKPPGVDGNPTNDFIKTTIEYSSTGSTKGSGFIGDRTASPMKQNVTHNGADQIRVWNQTNPVKDGVQRVTTGIKWDPSAGRWKVIQHFPEATSMNFNHISGSYTSGTPNVVL